MTPDRSHCLLALLEANKSLSAAHAAARRLGDHELAAYISDLAADAFATMSELTRRRDEDCGERVVS